MKNFLDSIDKGPIELPIANSSLFMRRLKVSEIEHLTKLLAKMGEIKPDTPMEEIDLSGFEYLFKEVLVGSDGERFEEFTDETTGHDIVEMMPMENLMEIAKAVLDHINKVRAGN